MSLGVSWKYPGHSDQAVCSTLGGPGCGLGAEWHNVPKMNFLTLKIGHLLLQLLQLSLYLLFSNSLLGSPEGFSSSYVPTVKLAKFVSLFSIFSEHLKHLDDRFRVLSPHQVCKCKKKLNQYYHMVCLSVYILALLWALYTRF